MIARRRAILARVLKITGLALLGIALVGFIVTEYIYFFPLTPLHLDTRGTTRLPKAKGRVRVLFVGDILLGDRAHDVIADRGHDYIFGATRQIIQRADLAVGNLEGPIALRARKNTRKRWSYKAKPAAARALARAGFDLMDLANNHIQDCGSEGIEESLHYLRSADITPFGAGRDERQAHQAAIRAVGGVRIGFLGYVPPEMRLRGRRVSLRGLAWSRRRGGAAWGAPEYVKRDIQRARTAGRADLVVVSVHLGDRYQREPAAFERRYCQALIDAGADAVIGHGAHILMPIEIHRGRPIFYGLGNFAFGSGNVNARFSLMAWLEIDRAERRLVGIGALPIYTVNLNPWVWFQTKVLVGSQARRVLGDLIRRSWRYNARLTLRHAPVRVTASP